MKKQITQYVSRNWLWLAVNIGALLPLIRLVWMVAALPHTRGPVMFAPDAAQNVILFSGQTALILLVLSLACTPVARIFNFNPALGVRKSLGLWGVGYASFHALFFMGGKEVFLLDSGAWWTVWQMLPSILSGLTKTPYARYGAYALLLLFLLAFTSNRLSMRLLRKNWKRLHRLVYLAAPLAVYHYWQREEFTIFTEEAPEYWKPAVFAGVVALLLIARIPPVRRWLATPFSRGGSQTRPVIAKAHSTIQSSNTAVVGRSGQRFDRSSSSKATIRVQPLRVDETDASSTVVERNGAAHQAQAEE